MASIHYEVRVKICCLMTSYLLLRTVLDLPCIDVATRGRRGHILPLKMTCNEMWLCTLNASLPPVLLLCDVVTQLPQRRVICRAQRGQSQPVADQSIAERSQWGQSQPGTDQSAAEGFQSSLLDQGAVNVMATVPP